jgi:ubiquitin-like protein ATG12
MAAPPGLSEASANAALIPDDDHDVDLPLTMLASVVLESLPRDAHAALENAGSFEREKGEHHLSPILASKNADMIL